VRRAAARAGRTDLMALWAGQAAALAGENRPADQILTGIVDDACEEIRRLEGIISP